MAKKQTKQYWFKPKKYGWGWGLPATWQGWLSYILFFAVWLGALAWLILPYTLEEPPFSAVLLFVAVVVIDAASFLYVSFKYGEPPEWRWGDKDKKKHAAKS